MSQQAELLALLAGSVRAGNDADALELRPLDTVRLADLEAPAIDPLLAFGSVAPHVAEQAAQVVEDLGGPGRAA